MNERQAENRVRQAPARASASRERSDNAIDRHERDDNLSGRLVERRNKTVRLSIRRIICEDLICFRLLKLDAMLVRSVHYMNCYENFQLRGWESHNSCLFRSYSIKAFALSLKRKTTTT